MAKSFVRTVTKTVRKIRNVEKAIATKVTKAKSALEKAIDEDNVVTRVKSSNLKSISYDNALRELYITFLKGNRMYVYFNVPQGVYLKLLISEKSKGKYFHTHIRSRYLYEEVKSTSSKKSKRK